MTAYERGILLLCCALGDADAYPLTMAQFRELSKRAAAMGIGCGDALSELTQPDLYRLGYDEETAAHVVALFAREQQLETYLRAAEQKKIYPVTRLSEGYPPAVREKRRMSCPPLFFCAGNVSLFHTACVGFAGSRKLAAKGRKFARAVGALAAREGLTLVTGGAMGADTVAARTCIECGGNVILFLPDVLSERVHLASEQCLVCSEGGYDLPFSTARAFARNALIHMMGQKTFIAQLADGTGGTWQGAAENLRQGWSELYVCEDGSAAVRSIVARGATAIEIPDSLLALKPEQASLFE